uniref:Cytochrome b n=1 Tax=Evania appendigaster TaxID=27486 RepID=C8YLY5_EVAAP|nr:cytochrome b [Evania appendigaster]ACL36010.1 cytochrome b [Evania appendigaster]
MNKSLMKFSPLNIMNNLMIVLPSPISISYMWNFGSMLGVCLIIQIITGLFLSMHYCPCTQMAFESIIHILQDVNSGWMMRYIHLNTASMFFMCMYMHIGRNIYFNSYKLVLVWISGIIIFMISMMTAFMGYVLPWGQMSFWGATVITNLVSTVPYLGNTLVIWLWGGFSVDNPTLNRFFSLHFIMPMVIMILVIIHLVFLHETGSNNPLGVSSNIYKIPFHPYFTFKDVITMIIMFMIIMMMTLMTPNLLNDPENFLKANPMITPTHIQPEWYFLFAYAILRSIPNKLGGVIALLMSILILMIMPLFKTSVKTSKFSPFSQFLFWMFINIFIILTWIGMKEIKYPFDMIGQMTSIIYFMYFLFSPIIQISWFHKFNLKMNYYYLPYL